MRGLAAGEPNPEASKALIPLAKTHDCLCQEMHERNERV